jgi:hypothetical protein
MPYVSSDRLVCNLCKKIITSSAEVTLHKCVTKPIVHNDEVITADKRCVFCEKFIKSNNTDPKHECSCLLLSTRLVDATGIDTHVKHQIKFDSAMTLIWHCFCRFICFASSNIDKQEGRVHHLSQGSTHRACQVLLRHPRGAPCPNSRRTSHVSSPLCSETKLHHRPRPTSFDGSFLPASQHWSVS